MPVIREHVCPVCKKKHTLFLRGEGPDPEMIQEFDCPEKWSAVRIIDPLDGWKTVDHKPNDSVTVSEAATKRGQA